MSGFLKAISPFHNQGRSCNGNIYNDLNIMWNPYDGAGPAHLLGQKIGALFFHAAWGDIPVNPFEGQQRAGLFDYLTLFSFAAVNGFLTKLLNHVIGPFFGFIMTPIKKDGPLPLKALAFVFGTIPFVTAVAALLFAKLALWIPRLVVGTAVSLVLTPFVAIKHAAFDKKPERWHARKSTSPPDASQEQCFSNMPSMMNNTHYPPPYDSDERNRRGSSPPPYPFHKQ